MRIAALAWAALSLAISANAQLSPAGEGRRVFLANNCYGCHGGRGGGSSFGAPALRMNKPELGDLTEAIREGEDNGMPSFPNLTSTDISNLYAYFRSMGTTSEPVFNEWWMPVPTASVQRKGTNVYATTRGKRRNSKRPAASVSASILAGR